jgi:hypothetical protein
MEENQCVALTNKGKGSRCPYKGKHCDPKTGQRYCGHHYKKVEEPAPKALAAVPKPELVLPYQLRRKVAQRLQRRLDAGPKSNDKPGFIYVYYLEHEQGRNYWKVGRTERPPEKRHKEWQDAHHSSHVVVTKKTWQVDARAHKFLESIIHLWFDYCRMYRYPVTDSARILSVWSATGSLIRDPDYEALNPDPARRITVARRKMVEWFWVPWPELDQFITRVCQFYSPPQPPPQSALSRL